MIAVFQPDILLYLVFFQYTTFIHGFDDSAECRDYYSEQIHQFRFAHPDTSNIIRHDDVVGFAHCYDVSFHTHDIVIQISSPRIDNQSSCRALLDAIEDGNRADGINIIALFDHEEIGSNSKQGAASIMLHDMLRRILRNMDLSENEIDESIYDAMLLSVDVAHALHPNKKEKMDITNKPVMGKGFCIKQACSQSYATDAQAIAILCQLCDEKGIPYQRFVNRSDSRGGSTLGSIAGTLLPVKTVDIGIPILAMHSACELMGVRDMKALSDCVTVFFGYH